MATKVKKDPKNQTNDRRRTDSTTRELSNDFLSATDLGNKFFTQKPLERIDDRRSNETQNLLNLRLAYADPNNASYAGRRSADTMDILSRMKAGLEGYTAPELNAFREKQTRGMSSNLNTSLNTLSREQNKSRTLGASSMAQKMEAMRQDREKRGDLEQDLFIKNADERRSRLTDYGSAVSNAENTEYSRGRDARGDYENTLNTDTADRFTKQQVNLGQERADRAGEVASRFGIMNMLQTERERKRQNALAKESVRKGIGAPQQQQSSGNGYADALDAYIKQMQGATA